MGCGICGNEKIRIKKRNLCSSCYQRERSKGIFKPEMSSRTSILKHENFGEINFIKNYFKSDNWKYQPALFHFSNGEKYIPDFYDGDRNVFIEVAATRQAYHKNKGKYILFKKEFPKIKFEIRSPLGELIDDTYIETKRVHLCKWEFQNNKKGGGG